MGVRFGYGVRPASIGPNDPDVGAPTQMAVFSRSRSAQAREFVTTDGMNRWQTAA